MSEQTIFHILRISTLISFLFLLFAVFRKCKRWVIVVWSLVFFALFAHWAGLSYIYTFAFALVTPTILYFWPTEVLEDIFCLIISIVIILGISVEIPPVLGPTAGALVGSMLAYCLQAKARRDEHGTRKDEQKQEVIAFSERIGQEIAIVWRQCTEQLDNRMEEELQRIYKLLAECASYVDDDDVSHEIKSLWEWRKQLLNELINYSPGEWRMYRIALFSDDQSIERTENLGGSFDVFKECMRHHYDILCNVFEKCLQRDLPGNCSRSEIQEEGGESNYHDMANVLYAMYLRGLYEPEDPMSLSHFHISSEYLGACYQNFRLIGLLFKENKELHNLFVKVYSLIRDIEVVVGTITKLYEKFSGWTRLSTSGYDQLRRQLIRNYLLLVCLYKWLEREQLDVSGKIKSFIESNSDKRKDCQKFSWFRKKHSTK